jgi:acetoin utilization protein AcuB
MEGQGEGPEETRGFAGAGNVNVAQAMSEDLVGVGPDADLEAIELLLRNRKIHHVLVVQGAAAAASVPCAGRHLVGIISDRDVLRETSPFIGRLSERPQDAATLRKKAHQIMTRELVVAAQDETVEAAAARMLKHGVSCLPVVSPDGRVEGIVSWRDLLRALLARA